MSKRPPPPPPSKPKHLASATATSTAPPARSEKRGLGWPWDYPAEHLPLYQPAITAGKLTWLFNWELWVPPGLPAGCEWVPCVRTAANAKDVVPFLTDIIEGRGQKVSALLGFNEPEIPDQANMGVDEAIRLWREVCIPARQRWGLRLGSPGISSDLGRSGPWLDEFLGKLEEDERPDFLVCHWYGRRWADMQWFLEECSRRWGLRMWVNEFACSSMGDGETSESEVGAFIREALPWLEGCEFVERYAYFGNGQGKTVGNWVGGQNDFSMKQAGGPDERALSMVGKLYTEL